MKESNVNFEQLQKTFMELNELKCILRKTQTYFEEVCFVFSLSVETFLSA